MNDGVEVRSYFHWSMLDNWEWGSGAHLRSGRRQSHKLPAHTETVAELVRIPRSGRAAV